MEFVFCLFFLDYVSEMTVRPLVLLESSLLLLCKVAILVFGAAFLAWISDICVDLQTDSTT
jgi:hypothetical protein